MTLETICHDPQTTLYGHMLDDSSSEQCLMREKKEDGGLMFMCSCTGEECNDMLIFPTGKFNNLPCIPRLYLASGINCVIPMDFGIAFCGGKHLVAGTILVFYKSCKISIFFVFRGYFFLPACPPFEVSLICSSRHCT